MHELNALRARYKPLPHPPSMSSQCVPSISHTRMNRRKITETNVLICLAKWSASHFPIWHELSQNRRGKKINIMYSNCLKRKHYQIVKIYNNILNVELYTTFTLKKLKSPNFLKWPHSILYYLSVLLANWRQNRPTPFKTYKSK